MSTTAAPTIIRAVIGPMPRPLPAGIGDPLPTVTVELSDGRTVELFSFYPDEISFTEGELLGLTEDAARQRKLAKDRAYLRS